MPERHVDVLVFFIGAWKNTPVYKVDNYTIDGFWQNTSNNIITHWQPLPDAPGESNTSTPTRIIPNGDKICLSCGNENPGWYAPNDLFNEINGSPNGVLCPLCFEKLAKQKGKNIMFKVVDPNEDARMVSEQEIEEKVNELSKKWILGNIIVQEVLEEMAKWMREQLTSK